jgi:hypothetical protein
MNETDPQTDALPRKYLITELITEIEKYLDAVELYRALGHEPSWRSEPGSEGLVIALISPYIDRVSPV